MTLYETQTTKESQFNAQKWARIEKDAEAWWRGELGRPLVQVFVRGKNYRAVCKSVGAEGIFSRYPAGLSPDEIVDRHCAVLAETEYLGDAFPYVFLNFGAGTVAAFLGSRLENAEDTVWFHPVEKELSALDCVLDRSAYWFTRVREVIECFARRLGASVQVSMPDIGGVSDILAALRSSEKLLTDLYDSPEEVKACMDKIHRAWFETYDEFDAAIGEYCRGRTTWTPIFSQKPWYMFQSDFSYMIGPDQFDEFVFPELEKSFTRMGRAFYHLDGIGQLAHLDTLLSSSHLDGIQWVPGAGQPPRKKWPDVYRKISQAGFKIQIPSELDETIDVIADATGRADNIVISIGIDADRKDDAVKLLERYSVPV